MHFSTGCAFTVEDIFMNFKYKKLKLTVPECRKITGDSHRQDVVCRVFRYCFYLVIVDIIEHNATFHFPLTAGKKCNMHMQRIEGQRFADLMRHGKWQGLDFIGSNFAGYQLSLYMLGKRTPRVKNIYLNTTLRDRAIELASQGMCYGDSINDTYVKDYANQVQEKFPLVCKQDILLILNFGWRSLYLHNSYGGDVIVNNRTFWSYFGTFKKDSLQHFKYYIKKLLLKIKIMSRRKKFKWDGYYYFALTEERYQEYWKQKHTKGRPRKNVDFGGVMLYATKETCLLEQYASKYLFRVSYPSFIRFVFYNPKLITAKSEFIEEVPIRTFQDILVTNKKYEFL